MRKQWYELLFTNYANKYENEEFVQGTIGECDFIEQELSCNKSLKIIDVGCGTGRHSIELAKRGYNIVGIDLSDSMIRKAKEKAQLQNLNVDFQRHDARTLPFINVFDAAIMICEGSFPLMETDEMNFEILKNITKALKKNGKLIFTTLNGLFPIRHSIEKFCASVEKSSCAVYKNNTFDLMTFRDHNITEIEDDVGNKVKLDCNERYYIPSEITWLLKTLGYKNINIFGAKLGAFSCNNKLTPDDFEMLVVAEKQS